MEPREILVPMGAAERGYYETVVDALAPGSRYFYRLNGETDRPDPASRFQPEGVHGPSEVISNDYEWHDGSWRGLPLDQYVIYELHVGTFSPEGTFDGVIPALDDLKELGVTAIEIMPVAQFPGTRNWGYDGTYPFAVQNSYGGPEGLRRLVDACHARGLAVILDVVYNHLGPEGNYFRDFGAYFTDCYRTPWGSAINFDNRLSDEVRRYFFENALYWIEEFHMDALRLDAVHAIYDHSAQPFLQELAAKVRQASEQLGRLAYAIPESDLNDSRIVLPPDQGGYGFAAQWSDDFHHALHCLLTGESRGYYADFGGLDQMRKAFQSGYVYTGEYSESRERSHGNSSERVEASQFVVFAQNHDQIGNRMKGERLGHLVSFEAHKLAAGVYLLSPFLPLIFMGEEYGEDAPFQYFVDHSDHELIEAVRQGRKEEFAAFHSSDQPPDPQAEETFERSKLNRDLRFEGRHKLLYDLYRELLRLRKTLPALTLLSKKQMDVRLLTGQDVLFWRRWADGREVVAAFHFGKTPRRMRLPVPAGSWKKELSSEDLRWGGARDLGDRLESSGEFELELAPNAFVLFSR